MSKLYPYTKQVAEWTTCPSCHKKVILVGSDARNSPILFICFECKRIWEAGVYEVEEKTHESL